MNTSKQNFNILILVLIMLVTAIPGSSQITYDGCVDPYGFPVASIVSNVDNVAVAARLGDGTPVIYYNQNILSWFQPQTRLFWYAHECAHHVLGHTLGNSHPLTAEQDADCWAINQLYNTGNIDDDDMDVIAYDIATLAGSGDWTHLPGPQRSINIYGCLDENPGNTIAGSNYVPAGDGSDGCFINCLK